MGLAVGRFEIRPESRELRHDGLDIPVQPLIFDLLLHFLRNANGLVTRDMLIREVWKGVVVSDGAVAQAVWQLRRILDDGDPSGPKIRTIRGVGYRLVADVPPLGAAIDVGSFGNPPTVVARQTRTPFVGREPVMELLRGAIEDSRDSGAHLILLSGEPGIGKTRTCTEFAQFARTAGVRVFTAHVPETGDVPSYWPWAELLRQALAAPEATFRSSETALTLRDTLLLDRQRIEDRHDEMLLHESVGARFELFDRVASFWISVATEGPVLVILDDVHRADIESLELLEFVVDRASEVPIVFVITFRAAALQSDSPHAHRLGLLARLGNSVSEQLSRLSLNDVAEFVRVLTDDACDEALAVALLERSGGNPFLLKELVWLLLRDPASSRSPDAALRLPVGLLPAIERHLDVVSAPCRDLLAIASVIGRDVDTTVLATMCDAAVDDVIGQLEEAVRAEVVVHISSNRFRFVHALLRDAIYKAAAIEANFAPCPRRTVDRDSLWSSR